jgi:hypothetical protein
MMPAYYTTDRKFSSESSKEYKDPHLSFRLQKEYPEHNVLTKSLLNELTKYRENIIHHIWSASTVICIVKFTQSGKTFMKKLLSGLVGACDTSKELVYFTVKAEG